MGRPARDCPSVSSFPSKNNSALLQMTTNPHCSKQPAAAASLSLPEPLSMKKWTVGVIQSLRSKASWNNGGETNLNDVICSPEYLSCALKIAHSLAEQLAAIEEERGYKEKSREHNSNNNDDNVSPPPVIGTLDKSWSEYISVYCMMRAGSSVDDKSNEGDEGHTSVADLEPLPYAGGDDPEPGDLQNLAQKISALFESENSQSIDYLNVRGAILNEEAVDGRPLSADGKLEIRSLGIALYELFSGGQIKAKAGTSQQQQQQQQQHVPSPLSSTPTQSSSLTLGQTAVELGGEVGTSKKRSQCNTSLDSLSHKTMVRTPSSISVEPLKLLGLPTALCDLISNMIDSVNGGDHGHGRREAYDFISEVRDDLMLMIDSPNVYLQDVDLARAANVGLQFGSSLYGRGAELQALKECYQRSTSSECEVAMICGPSGVGKSQLAREFARSLDEDEDGGSIFLSGRFDKLHSQPLHTISSAFDKYCAWLTVKDFTMAEKVATALKDNLGEEIASLVAAMPNLENFLGDDFDSKKSNENNTAVDAQKRLRYLYCQFVEVIARCHEEPLILFLDDCQWIDDASVALLSQILMTSEPAVKDHRLFFFMCCRDDEMSDTHPLNLLLSSMSIFGTKMTKIHLAPLSKGTVNEMVSTTLSLLPRITDPFANILHHKTKGCPFCVKQVMMELYKERLLNPSLSRRRWVWETDKILDMKIPENVAAFIAKSFDRLPPEVLSALAVLSCFGASADISLIEVLEREIQQSLVAPLEAAIAASVLGKKGGEFFFMHDKLQEAAYSMMRPDERSLYHNRYGLALGFFALRERNDRLLLTAVAQINHGGKQAVIDGDQAVVVANLNLDAGKIAMDMSDFFSAYTFFNCGISYLPRGCWDEQYDLSLDLFNLAAKCALMNAEHDRVRMLTAEIMRFAKCFQDKYEAISITVTLLMWSGNVPEAVALMNNTLSSLGEALPATITPTVNVDYFDNIKEQLASLSEDTLLSYPAMVNPSKILAVELLVKLFRCLTLTGERAAMPIIPLKMIQISLTHGMSSLSPVGFAQYGNYLAFVRDEFEEGYRYVKFALSLMKKIPSRAHQGTTMLYSNHIKLYVEPMQSAVEFYLEAYKAAMKSGDPYAIACSFVYDSICFWSGRVLNAVVDSMKKTMKEIKYHRNMLGLALTLPMFQMALRLMGQSDTPEPDDQDVFNAFSGSFKECDIAGKNLTNLHTMFFVSLSEALLFRELDKAREAADEYFLVDDSLGCHFSMSTPDKCFRTFYIGLVSFWIGREKNDYKWIARGIECKKAIEKLAASVSIWNFQNKACLLQAEEQFCERNFGEAEILYDAAILSSKTHKFVNDEALANELAGHFYLESGRRNRSVHYFSQAFEKYNEWGAVAKAKTLTQHFDGS